MTGRKALRLGAVGRPQKFSFDYSYVMEASRITQEPAQCARESQQTGDGRAGKPLP